MKTGRGSRIRRLALLTGSVLAGCGAASPPAGAAEVSCCSITVDDGAEGYEVPGVQVDAELDRESADLTVAVTRRVVTLRGRTGPLRLRNAPSCAARSAGLVTCRMPASWRERNADRRVEIVGSTLPDRLVAAPFTRGFGAHIILDGYRGDDTLVGGSGAAPGGWISLLGSWRGEWGHDQVLLSPAGPSVSPRIRSAGKTLLVDVGPSRRLAGTTLRLDVASCREWCWDVTTLARGRVTLASGHWTLARLRLTRAGRRIWRARDYNDIGIGFTSRTIRARVWVHDLLE